MTHPIAGVLPVLQTPFNSEDEFLVEDLVREIDWVFETGAHGVCCAMVSEILRLTTEERMQLHRLVVEITGGRGPVIASVGAESLKQTLQFAHDAEEGGCHALMAIPPITTALPEEALATYFRSLAKEVDLPVIVQDASSYVGEPLTTDFSVRLLDEFGPEKILFKPEGNPIGPYLSELREMSQGKAQMFDGSGGIYLIDAYRRGVIGTMPAVDLLDGIVSIWNAMEAGDDEAAYQIAGPLTGIVALQLQAGLDGFLAIEKYLLIKRGIFSSAKRREPYAWSLDEETRAEVDRLFDRLMTTLSSQ
ncbi:MAG: dihydrodipicolinate synthase family protein [Planctomycetaceae bacterium]|jgi:2-keto-3-deoxy-L-arabinonate dehydratase|nr:dihydrodipicolinate synthase family protein [Planctomycetaceae bacterium]MDG2388464.1 dihydrodipicolinate synthase family protein [Planctomycetaceae bacterium]